MRNTVSVGSTASPARISAHTIAAADMPSIVTREPNRWMTQRAEHRADDAADVRHRKRAARRPAA